MRESIEYYRQTAEELARLLSVVARAAPDLDSDDPAVRNAAVLMVREAVGKHYIPASAVA